MRLALLVVAPWVLAGLIVVSCAHAQVTFTTKGYIVVNCNGVQVSQHSIETEATESAVSYAAKNGGKASCVFKYPDKTLVISLATVTPAGTAKLDWSTPTQNTDGSALTDLVGFRIVYGQSPSTLNGSVQVGPSVNSYTVTGLTPGAWYFAVITVAATNQSALSNVASRTL